MSKILLVIIILSGQCIYCQTQPKIKKSVTIRIVENKIYLDTTSKTIDISYFLVNNTDCTLRFFMFTDQYWWVTSEKSPQEYQNISMGIQPFFEDDSGKIIKPWPGMMVYSDPITDREHPQYTLDSMFFRHIRKGLIKNECIVGAKDSLKLVLEYDLKRFFRDFYFYYNKKYKIYLRYILIDEIYYMFPNLLDVDKPKTFFGDISSDKVEIILVGKNRR